MTIWILWFVFALVVGAIGSNRNIGFLGAFVVSVLLSPIIGLIFTLVSKSKAETLLLRTAITNTATEQLEKLGKLKQGGTLTEPEFDNLKSKILMGAQAAAPVVYKRTKDNNIVLLIIAGLIILLVIVVEMT